MPPELQAADFTDAVTAGSVVFTAWLGQVSVDHSITSDGPTDVHAARMGVEPAGEVFTNLFELIVLKVEVLLQVCLRVLERLDNLMALKLSVQRSRAETVS